MNQRNEIDMEDVGDDLGDDSLWRHHADGDDADFSFPVAADDDREDSHVSVAEHSLLHRYGDDSAYNSTQPTANVQGPPSLLDLLAGHLRQFLFSLQSLKNLLDVTDPLIYPGDEGPAKEDGANNNDSNWAEEERYRYSDRSTTHPWTAAIQNHIKDLLLSVTALFESTATNSSGGNRGPTGPPLNVSATLRAAQSLVNSSIPDPTVEPPDAVKAAASRLYQVAENVALALSSSISQYLMAECLAGNGFFQSPATQMSQGQRGRSKEEGCSKSMEDLSSLVAQVANQESIYSEGANVSNGAARGQDSHLPSGEDADEILANLTNGVKLSLDRAKVWSKYCRDILTYMEKRAALELDYGKRLGHIAGAAKASMAAIGCEDPETGQPGEDKFLPFMDVYTDAFNQDVDHGATVQATANLLQTYKFIEPLTHRRLTHDRTRKVIKETWSREVKRMADADANLRKARASYISRQQEYERARERGKDASELTAEKAEKRKKIEEDAYFKVLETETNYKQCVAEANRRQEELIKVKHEVLLQLRELMLQCDQTMKAVTVTYYQLMHTVRDPLPQQLQLLAELARSYEPGHQYKAYVSQVAMFSRPAMEENLKPYYFIPYSAMGSVISGPVGLDVKRPGSGYPNDHEIISQSPNMTATNNLHQQKQFAGALASWPGATATGSHPNFKDIPGRSPGNSLSGSPRDIPILAASSGVHEVLDTEGSASGGSTRSLDQGNGVTSLALRRGAAVVSTRGGANSGGAVGGLRGNTIEQNSPGNRQRGSSSLLMSDNAKTHEFHRLRTPSKCRDCDKHLFLQGVECERCGLAAHKKCLVSKRLPSCEGQKGTLQRRLTTFGVDISFHVTLSASLVPPIVRRCIAEIDRRGLTTRGIYRVSAVKSKVEELCHQFERDQEGTLLSEYPPQVIANTLKLYFRQLPEPLLTHRLHHEFIRVSREDGQLRDEDKAVKELADIVDRLPSANFTTAKILMHHLHRVTSNSSANQMPASNLGIVFGPTLLKPSEDMASLSILMDTPHQARAVELLIFHVMEIFGPEEMIPGRGECPSDGDPEPDRNRRKTIKRRGSRKRRRNEASKMVADSEDSDLTDADTDDEDDDDDDYDEADDDDDDEEDGDFPAADREEGKRLSSTDFTEEVLAAGMRVNDANTSTDGAPSVPPPPAIPAHGTDPRPATLNLQPLQLQRVPKASPSPPPPAAPPLAPSPAKPEDKVNSSSDSVASHSQPTRGESPSSLSSGGGAKSSLCPLDQSMALLSQPVSGTHLLVKRPVSLSRQRSVSPIRSQDRLGSPARALVRQPLSEEVADIVAVPSNGSNPLAPIGHANVQYQPKMNQDLFHSSLSGGKTPTDGASPVGEESSTVPSTHIKSEVGDSEPIDDSTVFKNDDGDTPTAPSPSCVREPRFV